MEQNEEKPKKKRGLPKGRTNNPGGRPKGQPNRITTEVRTFLMDFFGKNAHGLQANYMRLQPNEQMRFMLDILPYIAPKVSLIKADTRVVKTGAEHLTNEELNTFIMKISIGEHGNDKD